MHKRIMAVLLVLGLLFPPLLGADECMEGDCDNGIGTGFTDDNKIYEGEWKDGLPHGRGKLYLSRGRIVEGIWAKGELVQEEAVDPANQSKTGK